MLSGDDLQRQTVMRYSTNVTCLHGFLLVTRKRSSRRRRSSGDGLSLGVLGCFRQHSTTSESRRSLIFIASKIDYDRHRGITLSSRISRLSPAGCQRRIHVNHVTYCSLPSRIRNYPTCGPLPYEHIEQSADISGSHRRAFELEGIDLPRYYRSPLLHFAS